MSTHGIAGAGGETPVPHVFGGDGPALDVLSVYAGGGVWCTLQALLPGRTSRQQRTV
ncbi:hypothetical protein [Streptomyces cinereospinus]|uniref:Uncharacterized protein n=1 Tax=Streptomyces cinereospinus TaxID=285561 RepID=A0ABV5N5J0_9ACTN